MRMGERGNGRRPSGEPGTSRQRDERSFAGVLLDALSGGGGSDAEPLTSLEYERELRLKNDAFRRFWTSHHLPGAPDTIIPSPKPRRYRTTTKRRARFDGRRLRLLLGGERTSDSFTESSLEPEEHTAIYRLLLDRIDRAPYHSLAYALNYIIIRGSYREFVVIFNVDQLNAEIVRKLKLLGRHLQEFDPGIVGAFVFLDPTRSNYYLESRRPTDRLQFKKLYGVDRYVLKFGERKYLLSPTSFSQINESMVPVMIDRAGGLLNPVGGERLLDLYCGYGLFAHHLSDRYAEVVGIDIEGESIDAARANLKYYRPDAQVRFVARDITADSLQRALPPPGSLRESILLDPPRQGTAPGVIDVLASRAPQRVLHIFCGVDEIPREVEEWRRNGYEMSRVIPLDMFPGTANLETMILLDPNI